MTALAAVTRDAVPSRMLFGSPPSLRATLVTITPKSIVDDASAMPSVSKKTSLALSTTARGTSASLTALTNKPMLFEYGSTVPLFHPGARLHVRLGECNRSSGWVGFQKGAGARACGFPGDLNVSQRRYVPARRDLDIGKIVG